MIEQFYPWYWKFYDMAEDDYSGGDDDDSDATDDTDDTGDIILPGEDGEDPYAGMSDEEIDYLMSLEAEEETEETEETDEEAEEVTEEEVDQELSYGEDEDAPSYKAPEKKRVINVSKITGNKILSGLEIKSSIGEELLNKISEGNISSNGDRSQAIITGSPGARFWLSIVDIDNDIIVNLQNVQIGESGKYTYSINFPRSSTANKYKVNLRVGDATRINPSLPTTDPMYTIHQRVNPTVTFSKATGTATGVTYSGNDVTFQAPPYQTVNTKTNARHSTGLYNGTNNVKLYGELTYTVTAAKGGAKVYIKAQRPRFKNSTLLSKITTQEIINKNIIPLNDVTNLHKGMEVLFSSVEVIKNSYAGGRTIRLSSTKDLVVGMRLNAGDAGVSSLTSIKDENKVEISPYINIPDKQKINFSRQQSRFIISSVDTNLNNITVNESVSLGKSTLLHIVNNETEFLNSTTVSNSGSASTTLTNNITLTRFGSRDVTFTLPTDDIFTLTPNAYDQRVETTKETAVNINVMLNDNDDNVSGKTPSTVRSPVHGKITGSYGAGDGVITYTPNVGFVGEDSFDFKVNDGTTDSEVKTIYITVHK